MCFTLFLEMKNKLRKISIDDVEYLYSVTNKYHLDRHTNTLTVKIYSSGQKQTPLVIEFSTIDDPIVGQPLKTGIKLTNKITNLTDTINLNEPKYIRELILLGQSKGWQGNNKMERQNGLDYLYEQGYETSLLKTP